MHIWKSYIRPKKLDVQETNICLTQFNGICEFSQFKHVTDCTLHRHCHLYSKTVSSLLLSSLFFFSSAYPQTDTAQLHNTHLDSCTHMDRTALEFNLSFVSLQNNNSSHCHLDIIHGSGASLLRLPVCRNHRSTKEIQSVL